MKIETSIKKRKVGRPQAEIDWGRVDTLLQNQCEVTSIANLLGISTDTLYIRCKRDNNLDFSLYSQQKKADGKELLRSKQFDVAMSGNVTMLIWLGKQYLEQRDNKDIETKQDLEPFIINIISNADNNIK